MLMSGASGRREAVDTAMTPGSAAQGLERAFAERDRASLVVAVHLQVERQRRDRRRVEAEIGPLGRQQAAAEQRARHEQHQRQRQLADHERVTKREPAAARLAPSSALSAGTSSGPDDDHAGARPKTRPSPATRRRRSRAPRGRSRSRTRSASGRRSSRGRTANGRPTRRSDARRAAEHGQQQRLGEQLSEQPGAAGADRRANRQLALPRRAAREQHARDVGAGNQQHEADRREQPRARGLDVAVEHGVEAHALRRHDARRDVVIRRRVRRGEPREDRVDLARAPLRRSGRRPVGP